MGAPISGKYGSVNSVGSLKRWTIADMMETQAVVASNTGLGSARANGLKDWNGSYECFGGQPGVLPGGYLAFIGYVGPSNGVEGENGIRYSGSVLITQSVINWDWAGSAPLSHTNTFGGNGALAIADGAAISDATAIPVYDPCLTKFQLGAEGEESDWPCLTTAALTLQVQEHISANSSSNCWKVRQAGPKNWSLAVTMENYDRSAALEMPPKGSQVRIRAFINASQFWLFEWGKIRDYTGITVAPETGEIVAATCNIDMDVAKASDGTLGRVVAPDGSTYWHGTAPA